MCKHSMWYNTRCSMWRNFRDHIHLSMLFFWTASSSFHWAQQPESASQATTGPLSPEGDTAAPLAFFSFSWRASWGFFSFFQMVLIKWPRWFQIVWKPQVLQPWFQGLHRQGLPFNFTPNPRLMPLTQRGHYAHPTGASAHLAFPSWNVPILAELLP